MEFPKTGTQCSIDNCKQLDFLPFTCNHCCKIFCKNHFPTTSHSCLKVKNNEVASLNTIPTIECFQDDCSSRSPVEMLCIKCNKHFCLLHRHHGCFEPSEQQHLQNLKKWNEPKNQFLEAKSLVDLEIKKKLQKSRNSSTAIKIQLMKLKSKSNGPNNVPISDRCYFLVHPPINNSTTSEKTCRGVFVSNNWSIGKVVDSISDTLNIPNFNNQANKKKLRLYNGVDGVLVTNQLDKCLSEFLNNKILVNGQNIILEYSDSDVVEFSMYE